jgi:predicted secreted acid phosphatase
MCSSSLFCKWLEVLTTIVGHIQKQHISNVLHQDNSKQQKLPHKIAQDAMDWKQKYLPVRERELTCLQNFKSKKRKNQLLSFMDLQQTIKNAFNEEV